MFFKTEHLQDIAKPLSYLDIFPNITDIILMYFHLTKSLALGRTEGMKGVRAPRPVPLSFKLSSLLDSKHHEAVICFLFTIRIYPGLI